MKKFSLVCTTFNSSKFLKKFLLNLNSLSNSKNLKLFLILNNPDKIEKKIISEVKVFLNQ